MTVTRTDMSTLSQRDEVSSSNGAASLKDEGARGVTEQNVAQAIPVLSDKAVNVDSLVKTRFEEVPAL